VGFSPVAAKAKAMAKATELAAAAAEMSEEVMAEGATAMRSAMMAVKGAMVV
jgi:hypothetical protein